MTHIQLGLGCSKELGSGPASDCAHEAGEAVSQDQPHHTQSQEGRWEEWKGNVSPPVCLGSSDSRLFPNWVESSTEASNGRFGWRSVLDFYVPKCSRELGWLEKH